MNETYLIFEKSSIKKIIMKIEDYKLHMLFSTFKKENEEPQINADERRFVNFKAHQSFGTHSEIKLNKSPQSTLRKQSIAAKIFAFRYGKAKQNRTRMTRIARIFTDTADPCASASSVQSVFYSKKWGEIYL